MQNRCCCSPSRLLSLVCRWFRDCVYLCLLRLFRRRSLARLSRRLVALVLASSQRARATNRRARDALLVLRAGRLKFEREVKAFLVQPEARVVASATRRRWSRRR